MASVKDFLLAIVGLIEAEEMSWHIHIKEGSGLNISGPSTSVIWAVRVQHRHELVPGADFAVRTGVPVVGPGEVSV